MANMMDALFSASQREGLQPLAKQPPTVSLVNGVGTLTFEALTLTSFEAGKAIPSRSRWQGKELRFEVTEAALAYVRKHWPNAVWLKAAQKASAPQAVAPSAQALPWEPRMAPFKHQRDACAAASRKPAFAFLMDMGTGKSKALVDDVADLVAEGLIDRVLLIAPNGVHQQWVDEVLPLHWPVALKVDALAVKPSDQQRKSDPDFPGKCPLGPQGSVWFRTVNFERLRMVKLPPARPGGKPRYKLDDFGQELEAWLKEGRAMVAIDESHRIKNPGARTTWAIQNLGDHALYRRILTGTPVAKGLEDYFSQFKFLDAKILGCDTMEGFKRQFCQMGGFQAQVITGYRNTEEFHQAISKVSWRVEKSEVLDLPPKLYSTRYVPLSPEQRATYNELKQELLLELSDGTRITAPEAVQRMLRLQQITQGFLPREDGTFEDFPHHRIEILEELVEQAPDKVVIWCRFRRDIDQILEHFGERCLRYDGQVTDKAERKEAVRLFADPGSGKDLFVANAGAGGTGLDGLQGQGSTVIYYSNSFNSLHRWQSEDRTHRIGTRGTVNYYDLLARGTMDAAILANLKRKRDISTMSLTELKALLEE